MAGFAIELPPNDKVDEPHAEADLARATGRPPVPFDPVEREDHAAHAARHRPAELELTLRPRQAAMLGGIGGKLVQSRAEMKDRIRRQAAGCRRARDKACTVDVRCDSVWSECRECRRRGFRARGWLR